MAKKKKKPPAEGKSKRGRGRKAPQESPDDIPLPFLKRMLEDPDSLDANQIRHLFELMSAVNSSETLGDAMRSLGIDPDEIEPENDSQAGSLIRQGDEFFDLERSGELYRQALEVAERELPKEAWGSPAISSTTAGVDYLTALERVAQIEWFMRRRDEAAALYEKMLLADPTDAIAARIPFSALLQEQNDRAGFAALLDRFPDDNTTHWAFHRALAAFQSEGDSARAGDLLRVAHDQNPYVANYLTGATQPPEEDPSDDFAEGGADEAVAYAKDFLKAWRTTAGASGWVRQVLNPASLEPEPPRPSTTRQIAALKKLPQSEDEVWQLGLRRDFAAEELEPGDGPQYTAVLTSLSERTLLGLEPFGGNPRVEDAIELLLNSMRSPMDGPRRRPGVLQLEKSDWAKKLQRMLSKASIQIELTESLDVVDELWRVSEVGLERINNRESHALEDLAALDQDADELWQAAVLKFPHFVDDGGPRRPWMALVISASQQLARSTAIYPELPEDALWQTLASAMKAPLAGDPIRPGKIELSDRCDEVRERLESLGIECAPRERLNTLDNFLDQLIDNTTEKDRLCPLVGVPGVRLEQVRSYFEAADEYYRLAPWNDISNEEPIKLECPKFESGTRYGIVMGQSGMTFGLSLHDDLRGLQEMLGHMPQSVAVRKMSALSLNYSEEFDMAARDLLAAERYRWPVAAPEAWPLAMHISPGQVVRSPLAWELELLEGCIRAIPPFLKSGQASFQLEASGPFGPLKMTVSRVAR